MAPKQPLQTNERAKRQSRQVVSDEEWEPEAASATNTSSGSIGTLFGGSETEKSADTDSPIAAPTTRKQQKKKQRTEGPSQAATPAERSGHRVQSTASPVPTAATTVPKVKHILGSVRFPAKEVQARYLEWLDKRGFTDERPLKTDELEKYFPAFLEKIMQRSWQRFAVTAGECNETLVRESYATTFDPQKKRLESKIKLRGKNFSFNDNMINEHYGLQNIEAKEHWDKVFTDNAGAAREWVVQNIASPD